MKRWMNDRRPDPEAGNVPRDMRDCRPLWKRFLMWFCGWKFFGDS